MEDHGLTGKKRLQQASEALIYASLVEHGLGHLMTFSDGAQPFDVFRQAQCWIHAERKIKGGTAAQFVEGFPVVCCTGASSVVAGVPAPCRNRQRHKLRSSSHPPSFVLRGCYC